MSTQYYRQTDDGTETGPYSREDLLGLVGTGELKQGDLLRSMNSTVWVCARHFIGLFQPLESEVSVDNDRSVYEAQIAVLMASPEAAADHRSKRRESAGWWRDQVGWEVLLAAFLVISGVVYTIWGTPESTRFPVSASLQADVQDRHFFFGTGPWSNLEFVLLWFDATLLIGALVFGRRILSRRK